MKLVVLYIFAMPFALLTFAAASVLLESAATFQPGAHGLSEVLYNFASTANNNGSAFAYQGTGTQWYTTTQGISMLMARFFTIIPVLAIGGSLAAKPKVPATSGTMPTNTALFGFLRRRCHRHRRRTHLLPRPRRWAPSSNTSHCEDRVTAHHHLRHSPPTEGAHQGGRHVDLRPIDHRLRLGRRAAQARPAHDVPQPGHVHRRDRIDPHDADLHPRPRQQHEPGERVRRAGVAVALVHGAVRQLRRGHGRRARQGAGGDAAQDPRRDVGQRAPRRRFDQSRRRRPTCRSATSAW